MIVVLRTVPPVLLLCLHFLTACSDDTDVVISTSDADSSSGDAALDGASADIAGTDVDVDDTPDVAVFAEPTRLVGHRTTTIPYSDSALTVEIWYPSTESGEESLVDFESGERARQLQSLVDTEGSGCHTETLPQLRDAAPAPGDWPLVLFSHCFGCSRWSSATVATTLAAAGYVVLSVDHDGTTIWDVLDESILPLDNDTLTARTDQLEALFNQRIELTSDLVSNPTPETYGWGHSFGVATTVSLAIRQPDILAIAAHAAPLANPLFAPQIEDVQDPFLLLVAQEDNSIQEIGNRFMRQNYNSSTQPGWLAELADAGHWSVSDALNLTPSLAPGCGDATRQTNNEPFTYIDPPQGRALSAALTLAFFDTLRTGNPALTSETFSAFDVFESRDLPTTAP
jgi:hypothetical protein